MIDKIHETIEEVWRRDGDDPVLFSCRPEGDRLLCLRVNPETVNAWVLTLFNEERRRDMLAGELDLHTAFSDDVCVVTEDGGFGTGRINKDLLPEPGEFLRV